MIDMTTTGFDVPTELRLMPHGCPAVPLDGGMYVVIHPERRAEFAAESVGGHFKGKNPTVSIYQLKNKWVEGLQFSMSARPSRLGRGSTSSRGSGVANRSGIGVAATCGSWLIPMSFLSPGRSTMSQGTPKRTEPTSSSKTLAHFHSQISTDPDAKEQQHEASSGIFDQLRTSRSRAL